MKKILISFIFMFYFLKINSITVYQCSTMQFLPEQCMLNYTDKNGDTHILLKICQQNYICQPNRDYSMGFCIFNVKEVPPGNKCYYSAECSTRNCDNEVCLGYTENKYCNPEKTECNYNMTCRKTLEENRYVYKCLNISDIYEECDNNYDCGFNLVCGYNFSINETINDLEITDNITLNDIKNYTSSSDYYLNLTENKTCINRASLKNGEITNEEMACESGQGIPIEIFEGKEEFICCSKKRIIKDCDKNNKCIIEVDIGLSTNIELEQDCLFSNIGNLICPLDQKEKAWKNYLDIYESIFSKEIEESVHNPYNKFNLQNGDVMKAYWQYFDWIHSIEGDECAIKYFFINNKSNMIFYNIYYLFGLIILYII